MPVEPEENRRAIEELQRQIDELKTEKEPEPELVKEFEDIKTYPNLKVDNFYGGNFIVRTSVSADLSGAAVTLVCLHTERPLEIRKAYLLYTEASSADAGVTVEIGKETDRNYYYTGTTEVSKSQWYTKEVDLLKADVAYGDTITFYSPGGKTGTGEIMLIISYRFK